MNYEALILILAELSKPLPGNGVKLLWYLIAAAIKDGGNELRLNTVDLSKALDMHRETVRAAAQALKDVILVTPMDGVGYVFHLPFGWFEESRGLFTGISPVENLPKLTEKPSASWWKNRQLAGGKTVSSDTPFADSSPQADGKTASHLTEKPSGSTTSWRENRQLPTQNQQLTRTAPSDLDLSSALYSSEVRDKIYQTATVWKIPVELVNDCSVLYEHMRHFARDSGSPHLFEQRPNELLMARCVTIAPLGDLINLMRTLRSECTRCGWTYAWFVHTFAQRIWGIRNVDLDRAFAQHKGKRVPKPQPTLEFATDLVDDTMSKLRNLA